MLNQVNVIGRLTKDPVLIPAAGEHRLPFVKIAIACDRDYKNGGIRETDFFQVSAWKNVAEFIAKNFTRGQMIAVSGRMQNLKYRDNDDPTEKERLTVEIVADNAYSIEHKGR